MSTTPLHDPQNTAATSCCGAHDGHDAAPAEPTRKRRTLPLWPAERRGGPHGSRSWATCFYRCGNACDKPEPNTSGNEHVRSVIDTALARRAVLGGAAVGAGALVLGHASPAAAADNFWNAGAATQGAVRGKMVSTDAFRPVAPNKRDEVTVPPGYHSGLVIAWGDPVVAGAPAFNVLRQTPETAAQQFGYNCDYVGVLNTTQPTKALLVVNHEYTNEELMFPAGLYTDEEQRRIALMSHGMSVVQIQRANATAGGWIVSNDRARYNRRITGETPFAVDGPVAGHDMLKTSADPTGTRVLGTLNNCAGGTTPWGTVLSGEENFNQYFGTEGEIPASHAAAYARYGITAEGSRGWHQTWDRFDLAKEPNEPNRFGWVVEVDPYSPGEAPVKHTMLGRFKHEGANVLVARNGRVIAYMGDDERGDYLYKFISEGRFDPGTSAAARAHNKTLLSKGSLFVAKLTGDGSADGQFDGTGQWIPLTSNARSFVPGFSVAEVLVHTRLAADAVQPTRMDRPEDVEPNPVSGKIYVALTNNSNRGTSYPTDEANPVGSSMVRDTPGGPLRSAAGNRNGYVLEIDDQHTGATFVWRLLLVCGDPAAPETYFAGFPKNRVSPISCPDNLAFDSQGNLWVSTDGNVLGSNDGIFRVPVAGPNRGKVEQFLTVPIGAEACGPLITHGDRTVWLAVQHPGEGGTFAQPLGTWPHTHRFPRPGVAVNYKF